MDGIDAAKTPQKGKLLALNGQKKFPASVVGGLSSFDTLNGAKCTRTQRPATSSFSTTARTPSSGGIIPIPADEFEPNDTQLTAHLFMFPPDVIQGTLPVGDDDWFTFTCTAGGGVTCADNQLSIFADMAFFDVTQGVVDPPVEGLSDYVINPLVSGQHVWLRLFNDEGAENYTVSFSVDPASP